MVRWRHLCLTATAAALIATVPCTPWAAADGLPVVGVDAGPAGVSVPGGDVRYVTIPASHGSVVAAVKQRGGQVLRSRVLSEKFTVPAVAYDGSPSGLSADGSTLVLIKPRAAFPRRTTPLAVLDAERLRVRRFVTLHGDFSFDAISPDGRSLYLVQYLSPRDPTRYLVRAYDLGAGRLLPEPIVDPRNRGEKMTGIPLTRTTSPDGVWDYTLYDGRERFVHALNTRSGRAFCIDLDVLPPHTNLYGLRLQASPDGGTVTVAGRKGPLAEVDTRTLLAGEPGSSAGGSPAALLLIPLAAICALGAAVGVFRSLRRRRLAPT